MLTPRLKTAVNGKVQNYVAPSEDTPWPAPIVNGQPAARPGRTATAPDRSGRGQRQRQPAPQRI